jgi:hypothetical protein
VPARLSRAGCLHFNNLRMGCLSGIEPTAAAWWCVAGRIPLQAMAATARLLPIPHPSYRLHSEVHRAHISAG